MNLHRPHRADAAEWPVADRRTHRSTTLVVSGTATNRSVTFASTGRPRRVVPLALALSLAILGFVQATSLALSTIGPPPQLDSLAVIDQAIAQTAH